MKETNEKSDEKLKRFITQDSLDLMFCWIEFLQSKAKFLIKLSKL
jgi:hypothetical protein